jgi:hypothetical protein
MRLTIRRVGGQLSTLRPTRVLHDVDLTPQACAVVREFVCSKERKRSAQHPDAFTYVFELEEAGAITTTSADFDEVPETLRPMLPTL